METGTQRMIARKDGAVGWMVFNNPARHNAVSIDMWQAVPNILDAFARDEAIRVVVLCGAGGKAFVSGADISEFGEKRASREATIEYNEIADRAHRAIVECRKPTIAMIQGYCIGGGLAVALCCDLRIASENSRFGVPAAKLGLGYGFPGIKRLADVVGPSFAKEIFFTARQFDTAEALQMGLVNRVRPAAELESYVREYAATIAAGTTPKASGGIVILFRWFNSVSQGKCQLGVPIRRRRRPYICSSSETASSINVSMRARTVRRPIGLTTKKTKNRTAVTRAGSIEAKVIYTVQQNQAMNKAMPRGKPDENRISASAIRLPSGLNFRAATISWMLTKFNPLGLSQITGALASR